MTLFAEYELDCDILPFVEVSATVPEATLWLDLKPTQDETQPFVLTLVDGPAGAVEAALESASFVGSATLIEDAGGVRRYQVQPAVGMDEYFDGETVDVEGLRALARTDAFLERIEVTPTGWIQACRFPDRETLAEFRTFWRDAGGFRLRKLTRSDEPTAPADGLTDCQRTALGTAHEMGYFEIPRRASLAEVAEELGITASSLSERLRRAQSHLVETTVATQARPSTEVISRIKGRTAESQR